MWYDEVRESCRDCMMMTTTCRRTTETSGSLESGDEVEIRGFAEVLHSWTDAIGGGVAGGAGQSENVVRYFELVDCRRIQTSVAMMKSNMQKVKQFHQQVMQVEEETISH